MNSNSNFHKTYILDLQTLKTYDEVGGKKGIADMGISIVTLINHETAEINVYTENEVDDLFTVLNEANLLVGIFLKKFCYKVLEKYQISDLNKIRTLDILHYLRKKIVFKPSIEDIFLGTLDMNTSCNYMIVPRLMKQGKFNEAKQYSIQIAKAINEIYSFGKEKGHILLSDKHGQRWNVPVNWE